MHMRTLLILFLICHAAASSAADNIKASILHYGIYAHTPDHGKTWLNPVSDKIITSNTTSPVHLLTTNQIPSQHPLFFGFEYQLSNLQDGLVKITVEVTHPPIQQADGSHKSSYHEEYDFLAQKGQLTAINGYLLENSKETQPGKWVFRVRHKNTELFNKVFHVTN